MYRFLLTAAGCVALATSAGATSLLPVSGIDLQPIAPFNDGGGDDGGGDGGGGDSGGGGGGGDEVGGGGGEPGGGDEGGGGTGGGDEGGGGGGGGTVGSVPEPASWAMMIIGFGLTGAAMRRRQQRLA